MNLNLTITGRRCDLALHPVSAKTVERIRALGRKFYTKKYIHWWRNGNTSTCGMKFDDECVITANLDGQDIAVDTTGIGASAVLLRRRHYLESKARYLALLGYDDEFCHMTWQWNNVENFDPHKFEFFVHRWDRIVGTNDFLIVDDVRYDGQFADEQDWGGSCGFTLVDPAVIDLDQVRREIYCEEHPEAAADFDTKVRPISSATPAEAPMASDYLKEVPGFNARGLHSCTTCHNAIQVDLRIQDGVVVDAGGRAEGCDYSKQCLAALPGLVIGKTVYECATLSNEDLRPRLAKVIEKLDCDVFTIGALKIALRNWERQQAA